MRAMNDLTRAPEPDLAALTVADVARDPRARDVLTRLGIHHCCGSHLSLAAAAAAAGVSFDQLRTSLTAVQPATIDVRGLEPPQPLVRVLKRLDALGPGERLEVIIDRRPLLLYPQLDARGFTHATEEPEPGLFRILIAPAGEA
jgi:tRNA 2-thiouridine synthesizing protein A